MIAYLSGTVIYASNPVIIDVHGVGYAVHIPQRLLKDIHDGKPATIYTYTHVREDALVLFGFTQRQDLELFGHLLTVSGIGPRTALGIMDHRSDAIMNAIRKGDADFFLTTPRLGKKNAQKIIIELRTKLNSIGDLDMTQESDGETKRITDALVSMGFEKREVRQALSTISEELTAGEKIKAALKLLGR